MAAALAVPPAATNMAEAPAVLAAVTDAAATDTVAVGILNMTAEPALAAAATDAVAVGIINTVAEPAVVAAATDAVAAAGGPLISRPGQPAMGGFATSFGVPGDVVTEAEAAIWAIRTVRARRHEDGAASGSTGSHETLETAMQPAIEGDDHMSAPPPPPPAATVAPAAPAVPVAGGVAADAAAAAAEFMMVDLTTDSDNEEHKRDVEMLQQQEQQDASDASMAPQLTLPNWNSLTQAQSALLAVQEALGCSFERILLLRTGTQRLQQLPADECALQKFRDDYKWLQTCLRCRGEAGAMQAFAKSLDELVDSLQYT
jgi:hypothetical protein